MARAIRSTRCSTAGSAASRSARQASSSTLASARSTSPTSSASCNAAPNSQGDTSMPFRLALSGLNAAQTDLSVTANNVANVQTTGFKQSRAEFADLFATSQQGVASTATGNGVRVSEI